MKITVLSPYAGRLARALERTGDSWVSYTGPISTELIEGDGTSFLVSYGYRHILKPPVVEAFKNRIINLHLSYLSWNRGADPNFWSFFDGTPKGVSIHAIDAGIDTGDILVQREVAFTDGATLASSYNDLRDSIETLFNEAWPTIRRGEVSPSPQLGFGTSHRVADKEPIFRTLTMGWDTPVSIIERLGITARQQ